MYNYREYLEFAEKYVNMSEVKHENTNLMLIPAILLSWVAIESFINNILDDFASVPADLFQLHERALLLEKRVILADEGENKGKFVLEKTEYRRIEEKIFFLLAKFGASSEMDRGDKLWQNFEKLKELRNNLMHPRKHLEFQINIVITKQCIETAKGIITFVAYKVWGKKVDI